MTLTKRGKATLLSALAFGTALTIYFLTRSEPVVAPQKVASNDDSAEQGRSLGRQLSGLLKGPKNGEGPAPSGDAPTHRAGRKCDKCTTENCNPGTDDGCDSIEDAADRKACEELYSCFASNNCVVQGDPIPCWCGKNMTTCIGNSTGPTAANGPCVKQVLAAAKTTDSEAIFRELLNAELPLGRAVRLTSCRGNYCSDDCAIR
ncbi:MAG TPA: hypothetical protein VJN68_03455 [Burkholderiaceae bacterium]|nr:hypothetical protein [Burkholderiaceae bacterium]